MFVLFLPSVQVVDATFATNELKQLQFGPMSQNVENYVPFIRLSTTNWRLSKKGLLQLPLQP